MSQDQQLQQMIAQTQAQQQFQVSNEISLYFHENRFENYI